ncbi:MAG: putative ribonucleotide transport ATP-binding protein mkl [bacterium]|nr:putative ribonucleotide transport ATP-binding protein mkl [bacterium]
MIEIRNLQKSFNGKPVLRGVDLEIQKGESQIIIGRSGCGKSVLLKHIIGLVKPDAGQIFIDGDEVTSASTRDLYRLRRKFGMLFQGAALFDSMTVEENVALGVREHRMFDEAEINRRVAEKLELVGLPNTQPLKPSELSGGMKKRVGLARALMMDPEFVLYDEPTTGLDPITSDAINDLIIECNQKLGVTSIVVTHDMTSAYKVGNRFAMLHEGQVIFTGTTEEVRNTNHPVVRQFIEGRAEGPLQID